MLENFMYKTKIKNNKLNKNVCKKKNWNMSRNCEKSKNNKKKQVLLSKTDRVSLWVGEVPQNIIEYKWFPAQ